MKFNNYIVADFKLIPVPQKIFKLSSLFPIMKSLHKTILLFVVLAFSINLVWEVSHSVLYDWDKEPLNNDVNFYVSRILFSTAGDLLLLTMIFVAVSLKNKNLDWIQKPKKLDYSLVAILGIAFAIFIEKRAEILHLWSYNSTMPLILGIGITPLIQLALTGIFVLWLLDKK